MSDIKIEVDHDVCDAFGMCVSSAPEVFDLNDDDELILLKDEVGDELRLAVEDAAAKCPVRAIRLQRSVKEPAV